MSFSVLELICSLLIMGLALYTLIKRPSNSIFLEVLILVLAGMNIFLRIQQGLSINTNIVVLVLFGLVLLVDIFRCKVKKNQVVKEEIKEKKKYSHPHTLDEVMKDLEEMDVFEDSEK